jgi:hypothetical protein
MQRKKGKNYWPHAILVSLGLIVLACVYTIVEALKHPVEMDTFYLQDYQEVDKNYDKIKVLQENFEKKYIVSFEINGLQEGALHVGSNNSLQVTVSDKEQNEKCNFNASLQLLLTRPETNKYNQNLTNFHIKECAWFFPEFTVEKVGRWQFQTKITLGEDVGFFLHEANATNSTN